MRDSERAARMVCTVPSRAIGEQRVETAAADDAGRAGDPRTPRIHARPPSASPPVRRGSAAVTKPSRGDTAAAPTPPKVHREILVAPRRQADAFAPACLRFVRRCAHHPRGTPGARAMAHGFRQRHAELHVSDQGAEERGRDAIRAGRADWRAPRRRCGARPSAPCWTAGVCRAGCP